MFEENDKALHTMRKVVIAIVALLVVGSVVAGIVLAVTVSGVMILITLGGLLLSWLTWVSADVLISYLCDIKLIRNKLYGVNNEDLEDIIGSDERGYSSKPLYNDSADSEND